MEAVFVVSLFVLYMFLWRIKQIQQKRFTEIDPNVMKKSSSNVQKFMGAFSNTLTVYTVIIILMHSSNIQLGSMFSRYGVFSSLKFDLLGFMTGLIGLAFCLYAQTKMGASWRVGIDEKVKTQLITGGFYKFIRNPTYPGLFLLNIGVWLIWPTWTVFLLNILFYLFLEIQVRCEEDYLFSIHGEQYNDYKKGTKRYLPFIY